MVPKIASPWQPASSSRRQCAANASRSIERSSRIGVKRTARARTPLHIDEPVPDGVLGHHARLDELQQVAGAAGLGAGAGQPVAAERLAADHRARDLAVDVEVADRRAVGDVVDGLRVAREQAAGERRTATRRRGRTPPRSSARARPPAAARRSPRAARASRPAGRRRASACANQPRVGHLGRRGAAIRPCACAVGGVARHALLRLALDHRRRRRSPGRRPGRRAAPRSRPRAARPARRGSPRARARARPPSTSGRRS